MDHECDKQTDRQKNNAIMHSNIVRRALKILVAADKLSVDNSYFTTINKYYDHILAQPEQLGLLPKKDTDDEDDRYIDVAAL